MYLIFIAQSVRTCWHCDRDSHLFSFLLPRGYQCGKTVTSRSNGNHRNLKPSFTTSLRSLRAPLERVRICPDLGGQHLESWEIEISAHRSAGSQSRPYSVRLRPSARGADT